MLRCIVILIWIVVISAAGPSVSKAQMPVNIESGLWTTDITSVCPAKAYLWTMNGDTTQFEDYSGNIDSEQIISRRPNGFITQTIKSSSVPSGTQWDYRFVGDERVEVRNLSTGKAFVLSRCPGSIETGMVRATAVRKSSPIIPTGVYSYPVAGDQGKMTVTEVPACQVRQSLSCLGLTVLKLTLTTVLNSTAHECDVDATENSAARVTSDGHLDTLFDSNSIKIDIRFVHDKAIISHSDYGGDFGLHCGTGATFLGDWIKLTPSSTVAPAQNGPITRELRAMFRGGPINDWVFICPSEEAYATIRALPPGSVKQVLQSGHVCKVVRGSFNLLSGVDRLAVSEATTVYGIQVDHLGRPASAWLIVTDSRD